MILKAYDCCRGFAFLVIRQCYRCGSMSLLPRKGVLAIVAVIDVALHAQGQPVAAKALADRQGLPPRHLEPVLQA